VSNDEIIKKWKVYYSLSYVPDSQLNNFADDIRKDERAKNEKGYIKLRDEWFKMERAMLKEMIEDLLPPSEGFGDDCELTVDGYRAVRKALLAHLGKKQEGVEG